MGGGALAAVQGGRCRYGAVLVLGRAAGGEPR